MNTPAEIARFVEVFQQYRLSKTGGVFIPFPPIPNTVVSLAYGGRPETPGPPARLHSR